MLCPINLQLPYAYGDNYSSIQHTPHIPCICIYLHGDDTRPAVSTRPVVCMSRKQMACIALAVGMVDERGYDGQLKNIVCDAHGPC